MAPPPAERDELLNGFARALFKGDMEALYSVGTPDFLWSFHDGLVLTRSLAGPEATREHLTERKALFSAQRFHEVAYHQAPDMTFMTFRVSETVRGPAKRENSVASRAILSGMEGARPRTSIASRS
jgi:hypothetical protein